MVQEIHVYQKKLNAPIVPLKTCKEPIHNAKGRFYATFFVGQKQNSSSTKIAYWPKASPMLVNEGNQLF